MIEEFHIWRFLGYFLVGVILFGVMGAWTWKVFLALLAFIFLAGTFTTLANR